MLNTPIKANDISEILQKKRNISVFFMRIRENIQTFARVFIQV